MDDRDLKQHTRTETVSLADTLPGASVSIEQIANLVRKGSSDAQLANVLTKLRAEIPTELYDGIHKGLTGDGWDDAVAAFGDDLGNDHLFYLGPMMAREDKPASTGLIAGKRNQAATNFVDIIAGLSDELGARLFGFPCHFHGRVVEFYDLTSVAGSLDVAPEAPIALFTPFYLAGWNDFARQVERRRTVLFTNVVVHRFRRVAALALKVGFEVDHAPAQILSADDEELCAAASVWLSLHELMHGSGPAPFFESWTGKSAVSEYDCIEEARVDMSAFLAAGLIEDILPAARLARELIVAERLFRSARRGLARLADHGPLTLDDEHGLCWLSLASQSDGLVDSHVNISRIDAAVRVALDEIYSSEQRVAYAENPHDQLRSEALTLRRMLLPEPPLWDPEAFSSCPNDIPLAARLGA